MISVSEALDQIFSLLSPVDTETVSLRHACGRVLAEDAVADRDQPPFAASAMDGYAVANREVGPHARFRVIGEAAAGRGFGGRINPGEAVRIFTGAPVPEGADHIVIQEDVTVDGRQIKLSETLDSGAYIRPAGGDFRKGAVLTKGRRLRPEDISLLASMNVPWLVVHRRPKIAILSTGDELVMPGETPSPDQIISSNGLGLATLLDREGAQSRLLPIARDTLPSLKTALALAEGADLVVTTGGASVGDHDLLAQASDTLGIERMFYKIAMRPGKPVMAGRIAGIPMIGMPGNPVSAMVCGTIFMLPAVRVLMGLPAEPAPRRQARLSTALPRNGPREHYMRAILTDGKVTTHGRQDSSLQSVLADANALLVRPPDALPLAAGEFVEVVLI